MTAEGVEFIQSKKRLMEFNPSKTLTNVDIGSKVGEDKIIKKKKNLLNFIRDGEKKSE